MLENTLANAERPDELIIYGGTGKAARDWAGYHAIVAALRDLGDDQTLVVQSGRPVAVFRTFENSPRVVIANANLVPRAATRERFEQLRDAGLTMHGQYTAGSWAYIGSQGIVQGTYEAFGSCAQQAFGGTLAGRIALTAGLGGMSSAQGPAVRMNGGVALICEVDEERISRRLGTGHVDKVAADLNEAWALARSHADTGTAYCIALCANAADVAEEMLARGMTPDIATDQTSAHDLLRGYRPSGLGTDEAAELRATDPDTYLRRAEETVARHARAMLGLRERGAVVFEYGNDLRRAAQQAGVTEAFDIPGFVPLFIRSDFAVGRGPFRWVCLSGEVADRDVLDAAARRLFPKDERLQRWLEQAPYQVPVEGLPARICWLGYGAREAMAAEINRLVRTGEVSAPVAITRDHLDSGSCAYPTRETEDMPDGSGEVADWVYLNAMLNAAGGADLVAVHQNAGVIGGSASAGMTVVCDGSTDTDERIARCFDSDPGIGVVRHAEAGVPEAVDFLPHSGINVPARDR
jgi:urocanate hydratase